MRGTPLHFASLRPLPTFPAWSSDHLSPSGPSPYPMSEGGHAPAITATPSSLSQSSSQYHFKIPLSNPFKKSPLTNKFIEVPLSTSNDSFCTLLVQLLGALAIHYTSAECKTVCTQPTVGFCNLLLYSNLLSHSVGRHFNFVHSADMAIL